MDTRNGRIYTEEAVAQMSKAGRQHMREMVYHPTPEQRARA